jgi:hypothetical protein
MEVKQMVFLKLGFGVGFLKTLEFMNSPNKKTGLSSTALMPGLQGTGVNSYANRKKAG